MALKVTIRSASNQQKDDRAQRSMQEYGGARSGNNIHVHTFYWPELGNMTHLIAREAGKCSLALCLGGRRTGFVLPGSFQHRPPSSISTTGFPRPLPSLLPVLTLTLLTPFLPCPTSTTLQLHLIQADTQAVLIFPIVYLPLCTQTCWLFKAPRYFATSFPLPSCQGCDQGETSKAQGIKHGKVLPPSDSLSDSNFMPQASSLLYVGPSVSSTPPFLTSLLACEFHL